jgi:hypothetical protein
MTTTDIAGLCERLRTLWLELSDAHAKPPATARIMNALHQSSNTLERQAAEIERLRELLRCIRDTPANEFDAVDVANRIRAALTGEDRV